jgi:hypothetical protein
MKLLALLSVTLVFVTVTAWIVVRGDRGAEVTSKRARERELDPRVESDEQRCFRIAGLLPLGEQAWIAARHPQARATRSRRPLQGHPG